MMYRTSPTRQLNHPIFCMKPSLEECCKLCTAAEGYFELGLFAEGSKLLESLPLELKISARIVLQRFAPALLG